MSVQARGTGFQMNVSHKGQRVRRMFDTYEDAVMCELQTKKAMKAGKPLPFESKSVHSTWTLKEAYNKVWQTYWSDCSTTQWQGRHMMKVLDYFKPTTLVTSISSAQVAEFVIMLKGKGLANSTINHSLQSLRKVMKYCEQNGKVEKIPVIQSLRLKNARTRYLFQEECTLLRQHSHGDLHDGIVLSLLTGVRAGELFRLRFRDVSKGFVYIEKTKNGDSRSIPAHPDVLKIVERRSRGRLDSDLIFTNTKMTRDKWLMVRNRLGLTDVVWHTLRHTFASHLIQSGVDVSVVKELMGHRRIETTMRYAKLAPKNFASAINALDI
jgi:site-specific recombinase XerD